MYKVYSSPNHFQEEDEHFANQQMVYNDIGKEFLHHSFHGYNTCIFAYGQTGAGKSFTMMGAPSPELKGIIPQVVRNPVSRPRSLHTPPHKCKGGLEYYN